MNWVKAAEGPIKDWVHVTVDQVHYCISRKKDEIHYEGTAASDLYLLLNNDKHRMNLADRASIVHRESEAGWSSERPDSWTVHYGGKSMKMRYDGSLTSPLERRDASLADQTLMEVSKKKSPEAQAWISKKIKKLVEEGKSQEQAAAIAYSMAREKGYDVPEKKADLLDDIAKNLGKTKDQLTDADIKAAADRARQMLQSTNPSYQTSPIVPTSPAVDPSMTPPNNMAPLPGQSSSVSVRWLRDAAGNPFGDDEADDDKDEADEKEEPKEEKAPEHDEPKDDKEEEKLDKKDIKNTEKAIKLLEKVLKNEKGEGEAHAEEVAEALELLKQFVGEESQEHEEGMPGDVPDGIPIAVDLEVLPDVPGKSPVIPMGPMSSSWTEENRTGFREGMAVWRKDMVGSFEYTGDEPGRVIAIGNGKVVVDWGDTDGIPTEEDPSSLVKADKDANEETLFSSTNVEVGEAVLSDPEADEKTEIEQILSGLSLKDIMNKASSGGSNPNAIEHVATGRPGVFLANASDGRCLVRIGDEEMFVWQYEIKFKNTTSQGI